MSCPVRKYPLRRPEGHQPPVPRWQLQFDEGITKVYTAYIGVQQRKDVAPGPEKVVEEGIAAAVESIRGCIVHDSTKEAFEEFESMEWNEKDNRHVFVCYWNGHTQQSRFLSRLRLRVIHDDLPQNVRPYIGLWIETFHVPVSRLETNYSGLDYLPGFARLPQTSAEEHTLTAYWGAARDRLGASASDLFEETHGPIFRVEDQGAADHLVGYNLNNIVHIRTGQYWQNCGEEELHSYEHNLEPTLRSGLSYLRETPSSGATSLRYLRNTPSLSVPSSEPLKETCVTGFFTSLDSLESWAKHHKSHLAIFNGAMRHAKKFGPERKFRTWHEVVVLKEGEGRFEYVNCDKGTGVLER